MSDAIAPNGLTGPAATPHAESLRPHLRFSHAVEAANARACPTAAIGRRLAKICAMADAVEPNEVHSDSFYQLESLRRHLLDAAEWTTPKSLDGLMVIAIALFDAVEDLAEIGRRHPKERDEDPDEWFRFQRTSQRLMEGLIGLAGHSPSDIGLGYYWSDIRNVAPDQSDLEFPSDLRAA